MELITRKDFKDNVGNSVYVTYVCLDKSSSKFFSGQLKPVKRKLYRGNYSGSICFGWDSTICSYQGSPNTKIKLWAGHHSNGHMVYWKFFTTKEEAEEYVKNEKSRYVEDIRKILMSRKLKHLENIKKINEQLFNLI